MKMTTIDPIAMIGNWDSADRYLKELKNTFKKNSTTFPEDNYKGMRFMSEGEFQKAVEKMITWSWNDFHKEQQEQADEIT